MTLRGLPRPVLLIGLGLLALLGMLAGRAVLSLSGGSGDAQAYYAQAQADIAARDLRSARIELMNAVKARPGWGEAYVLQAQVALALFDAEGAKIALDRAEASGIRRPAITHLLGQTAWMQGELDLAVELLASPDIPQHNRAAALRYLGRVELDRGNFDTAKAAFDEALALTPQDSDLWTDIGRYRFVVADSQGAIEAVDHAVALNNNNVRALEFRGRLVRSQFGLLAALPWFERGLQVAPDDVPTLEEYAATLGEAGRYTDMLRQLRKIVALDARNGRAFYMQAVIAARAGNFELAKRILPRAGSAYLQIPAPMMFDAIVEYQLGNWHRAIDLLDRLLADQPRNDKVRILLARAQQRAGEHYDALETIRPIAEREDAGNYAQMLAARSFEAIGERGRAAAILDMVAVPRAREALVEPDLLSLAASADEAARYPNSARAVIPYIRNLMVAGDLDRAAAEASRMAEANPGVADAHLLVGDVEMAWGNLDAAIGAYGRVRQISFSEPVMLRLVDALRRRGTGDEAREVLSAYLALNPTDVKAMRLMAYDHLDHARWAAAIPLLQRVKARLGPYDGILLANLARAYSGAGRHKQAVQEAALAYRVDPANLMVTRIYGQTILKAGTNPKAAVQLLEKAQAQSPDDQEIAADLMQARRVLARSHKKAA